MEYFNSDCSVCKRLGKLLREDSEVSEYYNANYISYAMNTYNELPAQEHAFLKNAHLNFNSVPVLLYFDKDKKFLHYSTPEINAEFIISEGKKALFPAFNAAGLKSKYEAGDRTVRTLYAFSSFLVIQENTQLLNKVTQELYDSFRKGELPTKKSYIILKNVVQSSDNGFFQYWINNLSGLTGFESGIKSGTEFSYLQTIVLKEVSDPNSKNWDEAKKNKYKEYIVKLKMSENPDVFFEIL
ncbi:hypothetical protein [Flavobacterium tegetincola]|uniref:hypothetical protein n=1 Tax=Flavobacterium tegetincola TaxID=150172 RepID=UPI00316ACF4C